MIAAKKEDEHYDPDKGTRSRKELKCLINDDSVEAKLIADTLQRGLSVTHATVLVNELRKFTRGRPRTIAFIFSTTACLNGGSQVPKHIYEMFYNFHWTGK